MKPGSTWSGWGGSYSQATALPASLASIREEFLRCKVIYDVAWLTRTAKSR